MGRWGETEIGRGSISDFKLQISNWNAPAFGGRRVWNAESEQVSQYGGNRLNRVPGLKGDGRQRLLEGGLLEQIGLLE